MMGHPHIGAHVDTIEDPLAPLTQIVGRQHLSDRMS
jgi:hypothetical protein